MTQMAFYIDDTRCTGCKTCVFACKDKNNLDLGMAFRKVYEFTGGETTVDENGCYSTSCFSYYISVGCNHCDNPACLAACGSGAVSKDAETGIVTIDPELCEGCGSCAMACPYGAVKVDPELGVARKCDACVDELAEGKAPACVLACPARALKFGPVEEIEMLGERLNVAPLAAPDLTMPNFFVKQCQDCRPSGSEDGVLANPLEVDLA